jgi:hypothetical protein
VIFSPLDSLLKFSCIFQTQSVPKMFHVAYGELNDGDKLIDGMQGEPFGGDGVPDEAVEGQGGSTPSV